MKIAIDLMKVNWKIFQGMRGRWTRDEKRKSIDEEDVNKKIKMNGPADDMVHIIDDEML